MGAELGPHREYFPGLRVWKYDNMDPSGLQNCYGLAIAVYLLFLPVLIGVLVFYPSA